MDDLLEKYKDLDPVYVSNKLEEYDHLVQYYFILCTKQQMKESNVEPDEWWELVEVQFKKEIYKNLDAQRKDEDMYKRHLSTFKKAFPNLIYSSLGSSEPSSPAEEAEGAKYIGATCRLQEEELKDFKGGGHDLQNKEVEEQVKKIPVQETELTSNDTGEYREQLEAKNIFEELQELHFQVGSPQELHHLLHMDQEMCP